MNRSNNVMKFVVIAAYVACIVTANWMIGHVGTAIPGGTHLLPVGFGLLAPSGTYAAALTLVARDLVQRLVGRWWSIAIIPVGAAVTALFDPRLALASGLAFLLSEGVDFVAFTLIQGRSLPLAVLASAGVGDLVDSTAFLALAGIPFAIAWPGQVVGKGWAVLAATAVITVVRRRISKAATA